MKGKKSSSSKTRSSGRGSKKSYSAKQQRKAQHIEDSYENKGAPTKKAERIAWATVNKQDGGARGKKSSGTKSSHSTAHGRGSTRKRTHAH